ncbi:MAG: hypothetical protein V4635_09475 [Bacteroidota bacterium]
MKEKISGIFSLKNESAFDIIEKTPTQKLTITLTRPTMAKNIEVFLHFVKMPQGNILFLCDFDGHVQNQDIKERVIVVVKELDLDTIISTVSFTISTGSNYEFVGEIYDKSNDVGIAQSKE